MDHLGGDLGLVALSQVNLLHKVFVRLNREENGVKCFGPPIEKKAGHK